MAMITVQPTTETLVMNDVTSYNCTAAGLPLPTINWLLNGVNASNIVGYSINIMIDGPRTVTSTLNGTVPDNNTEVTCRATNRFNTDDAIVSQTIAGN